VYDYSYGTSQANTDPAVLAGVTITFLLFGLVLYIINSIFLAKVFKKAGVEGWKAWVPIYNAWVMLELGDQPGWISLLTLTAIIPVVGFITALVATVFLVIAAYKIGLRFGKDGVFVLLYIFLPLVWVIWLAVDSKAVWKGAKPAQVVANDQTPPSAPTQPTAM
jgi:hypothetical protein